jgi:outer membrane receptor for ferrienterochelin and colicin
MKKLIILHFIVFILSVFSVSAQVRGIVKDGKGEPIPGVNIFWLGTANGVASEVSGEFELSTDDRSNKLVFSSVSYNNDTLTITDYSKYLEIKLNEVIELAEVSVVQRSVALMKPRGAVIQTDKITGAELCKAACCNLSESFETNPSVDVSYSDAATGAKQIRMLGLSGAYVQMLTENIPNLRGISSAYGLGFIPGPWMESIQVSKGTSSVVNGYEAITGQINVEYKKPQTSEKVAANLFLSDAGRIEANANASLLLSDKLSTGVLLHASDEFFDIDHNHDGFMDMPKVRQLNFINRWYYKTDNYTFQAFARALNEKRTGGQIHHDYKIGIDIERYEFFMKNGYVFNHEKGTSIGTIVSGSWHHQNALYGHPNDKYNAKVYDGKQGNLYANFIFQTYFTDAHKLSTGISLNLDNYNELIAIPLINSIFERTYPKTEFVPGIFAEYTLNINEELVLLAGLRGDYSTEYGFFATPRLHLKYNLAEFLHLRASAGKGYRSPNVWAENNYLFASSRNIYLADELKMEEAWNYGTSLQFYIPMFGREMSLSGEWYYTNFINQVVVDMDSNPHQVIFSNLDGKSYASSIQVEMNMEILKGLTLTAAHRITDVKTTINGVLREKPLTNKYKALITTSYQTPLKKWQFDYTVQFNGGGRLPDPDAVNPQWETAFKPYTMMNAQVTKYFKTWSVYVGSENLTGFVQKNPIIDVQNPFGADFDASLVWGPMHKRKLYIGFRWALDRD